MASTASDRQSVNDKMIWLASYSLNGLETWIARTPFNTEIVLGHIKNCNRMVEEKYPLDIVKYVNLLHQCKELVPPDSPLIEIFDTSIERAQEVKKPTMTEGFLDVLTKVIQALKNFDDANPWISCKLIYDAFSQFIDANETTPGFWKLPCWSNYTFEAEISKLNRTLADDNEHEDMIRQILAQIEVWRAKITENSVPS